MRQNHQSEPNRSGQVAVQILNTLERDQLEVSSPAFENGDRIPDKYAAEHNNISPPLRWQPGPEGTRSYALILEDPDAPQDAPFVHWVLYNLPSETTRLEQSVPTKPFLDHPRGALQGINDRASIGYFGPLPPRGDDPHEYHVQLFALDTALDLDFGATVAELEQAMQGHILATGHLVGTYQR